jgi:hypothetical protein
MSQTEEPQPSCGGSQADYDISLVEV